MGKQQSGVLNLQIADLVKDKEILLLARHEAMKLLKKDPSMTLPEHQTLRPTRRMEFTWPKATAPTPMALMRQLQWRIWT